MRRFTSPRQLWGSTTAPLTITHSHHWPRISRFYSSTPTRPLLTLAIETSCDDTCVAVLERSGPSARLLFNKKITSDNRAYGGIHPGVAVIGHDSNLATLIQEAIHHLPETTPIPSTTTTTTTVHTTHPTTGLPVPRRAPDFISATRGPGIPTTLSIGLNTAKGLACAWNVPLLGIHHMQAHALTPRLVSALSRPWPPTPSSPSASPAFPFLTLLISGGHTLLLHSTSLTTHRILASSPSHAIGNMLDAAAREILPAATTAAAPSVMYGALLERFTFPSPDDFNGYTPPARRADEILPFVPPSSPALYRLTPPLHTTRTMAFNFTHLNNQVTQALAAIAATAPDAASDIEQRQTLAYGLQKLAFEHLGSRVLFALQALGGDYPKTLVVSGGVAANGFLRHVLRAMLDVRGFGDVAMVVPPGELCTDNAAMVAWAGMEMFEAGWRTGMRSLVKRRWSLDEEEEGGGVLGVEGWWNVRDGNMKEGV